MYHTRGHALHHATETNKNQCPHQRCDSAAGCQVSLGSRQRVQSSSVHLWRTNGTAVLALAAGLDAGNCFALAGSSSLTFGLGCVDVVAEHALDPLDKRVHGRGAECTKAMKGQDPVGSLIAEGQAGLRGGIYESAMESNSHCVGCVSSCLVREMDRLHLLHVVGFLLVIERPYEIPRKAWKTCGEPVRACASRGDADNPVNPGERAHVRAFSSLELQLKDFLEGFPDLLDIQHVCCGDQPEQAMLETTGDMSTERLGDFAVMESDYS